MPSSIQGISDVYIIVDVFELAGVDTDGPITIRIPSDSRFTFDYDETLSNIGFDSVNNSDWTYQGDNGIFHVFTANTTITGNTKSSFGYISSYDPENTEGQTTLSVTVVPGSGNECEFVNNFDAEVLIYFE